LNLCIINDYRTTTPGRTQPVFFRLSLQTARCDLLPERRLVLTSRARLTGELGEAETQPPRDHLVRLGGALAFDLGVEDAHHGGAQSRQRPGAQVPLEALTHRPAARQATRLEQRGLEVAAGVGVSRYQVELIG